MSSNVFNDYLIYNNYYFDYGYGLNQKFMKDRVETEEYARNQLISKNSILSEENLSLKTKC